mmetsp:Transcript_4968/g.13984  ORF Transcript_4968/g.13984 Transcript_4968/m.13984 type:complete len:130 (-) Transcript_4968:857-1246(-)
MTAMTSARRTVLSLWAISMTVQPSRAPPPAADPPGLAAPSIRRSMAACTRASFSASRWDVASSRIRSRGRRRKARAMAILCRWPPLRWLPPSPTFESRPSSIFSMNSVQLAASQAASSSPSSRVSKGRW